MRLPRELGRIQARFGWLLFVAMLLYALLSVAGIAHADTSREKVSLNGVWDFYPNGGTTRYDITVPSYWDSPASNGYPAAWNTLNYGVYKRNFTVPTSMTGKEIFLDIANIGPLSKVFLNGTQLIPCFIVREHRFELILVRAIFTEAIACRRLTLGI